MGQYYKPVILADDKKTIKAFGYSHDYGNGLKLMEHSYLGNEFMLRIERELEGNPQRLVWAGDYAGYEESENDNLYGICCENESLKLPVIEIKEHECRYIVNHDKRVYIDKEPIEGEMWGEQEYKIHPLSLLTSEGNGQGGGDYRGRNSSACGSWARDKISLEVSIPEGFEKVKFDFKEG
jgi:hypothetical protein